MEETTKMTTTTRAVAGVYESDDAFATAQRVAKSLSVTDFVPKDYKGNIPNCLIALDMSRRLGELPLTVMQHLFVVHGRPGWSAQYMIARVNSSGVFKGRINWRVEGRGTSNLSVTAYATLNDDSGEVVEFTCDMAMAKAEGWTKNNKYRTMPEVMLRYRSASFLIRFYCPEVMLGISSVEDARDAAASEQAQVTEHQRLTDAGSKLDAFKARQSQPIEDADVVDEGDPDDAPEVDDSGDSDGPQGSLFGEGSDE